MSGDLLQLRGLLLSTRLGITDAERAVPQRVLVTVSVPVNARSVGGRDDLQGALDYARLREDILALAATERRTLERLAEDIAKTALSHPDVTETTVELHKFPFPDGTEAVLTITRAR